jgi:hypothetical protein
MCELFFCTPNYLLEASFTTAHTMQARGAGVASFGGRTLGACFARAGGGCKKMDDV